MHTQVVDPGDVHTAVYSNSNNRDTTVMYSENVHTVVYPGDVGAMFSNSNSRRSTDVL